MPRYIDVDALLKQIAIDSKGSEGSYGDKWLFIDTIEAMPVVTINDLAEKIKVTNCNHNAEVGKKVSISRGHENGKDVIYRQDAIDILNQYYCAIEQANGRPVTKEEQAFYFALKIAFAWLPSAQPEPLTDKEQRIFLAAMGREEKVCKQVDDECRDCREPYEDSLVSTCHEITRKVKGALWMI